MFSSRRRQEELDKAVKLIGRNVTGVRGDAAISTTSTVCSTRSSGKGQDRRPVRERGMGEPAPLGEITEQHFDATFGLNTRGTLFTVQKALPLFNDGGSIFMTGPLLR